MSKQMCDCRVDSLNGIVYCPLHKAAPEMYAACKAILKWQTESPTVALNLIAAAVAKADAKAEGTL